MFNNFIDIETPYQTCTVIQPSSMGNGALLLGDLNSVTDQQTLTQYHIKTIITAASGMEHLKIPSNIQHFTYPLLDTNSENILKFFNESTNIIQNCLKTGGVLVHCAAGISRSATLVIAYIMKTRKMSFKQAIAFVRTTRKNVRPNLGFERQLKHYQKQLFPHSQHPVTIKKSLNAKLSQQQKTTYNSIRSSQIGRIFNNYIKGTNHQPHTAQQGMSRKHQSRRLPYPISQSRARDKKKSYIRPMSKEGILIYGHGNSKIKMNNNYKKDNTILSDQIIPPIIQNHHRNAGNQNWIKFYIRKWY